MNHVLDTAPSGSENEQFIGFAHRKIKNIDSDTEDFCFRPSEMNKPRTAQVGVISKAQKYSWNNYCEVFQLSHSAEKRPKVFFPGTRELGT